MGRVGLELAAQLGQVDPQIVRLVGVAHAPDLVQQFGLPDQDVLRPAPPASSNEASRHGLLQAIQSLVYIIIIALFIITFTVQPFRIPSESMEPTLLVGDFLLVNKQVSSGQHSMLGPASVIHRGDLIVFHYPVDPSLHLVARAEVAPESGQVRGATILLGWNLF